MWNHPRLLEGIRKTGKAPRLVQFGAWIWQWKQEVECLDCGHVFETIHCDYADNARAVCQSPTANRHENNATDWAEDGPHLWRIRGMAKEWMVHCCGCGTPLEETRDKPAVDHLCEECEEDEL